VSSVISIRIQVARGGHLDTSTLRLPGRRRAPLWRRREVVHAIHIRWRPARSEPLAGLLPMPVCR